MSNRLYNDNGNDDRYAVRQLVSKTSEQRWHAKINDDTRVSISWTGGITACYCVKCTRGRAGGVDGERIVEHTVDERSSERVGGRTNASPFLEQQ